jgi:hypothetical protein
MIPIKGYATFDPLKHCWIGSGFKTEWFRDLDIHKNDRIMDPLKRIAEETEEDYQTLEKILKDAGVQTYRSFLDIDKAGSLKIYSRPPVNPRDHFAVIGEKFYACSGGSQGYADVLKQIAKEKVIEKVRPGVIARLISVGLARTSGGTYTKDLTQDTVDKYKKMEDEGFRVHISNRGYHSDGSFCVVNPGCIVSLHDIQDYKTEFPGWDVLYLPDQSGVKVSPFLKMKKR